MSMGVAVEPRTGLVIPQARLYSRAPRWKLVGTVTYVCFTCGELIVKPWECLYVDDTPGREWASSITPAVTTARTTTHHDWHLSGLD